MPEGLMLEEDKEQAADVVDIVRSGAVKLVPRRAEAAAAAAAAAEAGAAPAAEAAEDVVDQGDVAEAVSSEEE